MQGWQAVLLGAVEGLTEFLPVSSTGHLVLLGDRLGATDEASKAFEVVVQLGAVLAVALHYRQRLGGLLGGMLRRETSSLRLGGNVTLAFLPSAVAGLLLHRAIKAHLFGPLPVAMALIAGGLLMVSLERLLDGYPRASAGPLTELEQLDPRRALVVGLTQCLSLWPGMSRSMTSIVGGRLCGLDTRAAAEFSFLLAIPTLGAATLYDLAKSWRLLLEAPGGVSALGLGLLTSFVVAWGVVAVFLRLLGRLGLAPFGYYRIALGLAVFVLAQKG